MTLDNFDLVFTRLRRGQERIRGEEIRQCSCGRHFQASTGREEACPICSEDQSHFATVVVPLRRSA